MGVVIGEGKSILRRIGEGKSEGKKCSFNSFGEGWRRIFSMSSSDACVRTRMRGIAGRRYLPSLFVERGILPC